MNDMSTDTNEMDVAAVVANLGQRAKAAAQKLSLASAEKRNQALNEAAKELRARASEIVSANATDLNSISGKDAAFIDRLTLTEDRVAAMAASRFSWPNASPVEFLAS